MHLLIDGQTRALTPLKDFRAQHALPPEFQVALFEPKDYTGLGSIERAGAQLNSLRQTVLEAIAPRLTPDMLFHVVLPRLEHLFEQKLYAINPVVGLNDAEIGFAVSGFSDVLRHWGYALVRARLEKQPHPEFARVYGAWLNNSIRISQTLHPYTHGAQTWRIQVLTHAYGRFGLAVHTAETTYYVYDAALGCPAEGFMQTLLADVVRAIEARL
ncbi:MAG: hypothetical protein HXY40_04485 [Chloroflexi bacterium]|nr:hypothetical protein [Chloroflexota bacterium]